MSCAYFRPSLVRTAVIAAACGGLASGAMAQFVQNDLYLASTQLPVPGNSCGVPAVLRINTTSWQSTVVGLPRATFAGRAAYDASRSALLLMNNDSTLDTMSSNGVVSSMPPAGANNLSCFAPTGDGRIYFWGVATHQIRYYDSANNIHTLMGIGGSTPYQYPIRADAMFYDAGTNALFVVSQATNDFTQVTKIPLNAAGTAVTASVTVQSFDASPGFNTEICMGISKGPGGKLFLAIDDNGGGDIGRMQTIDPVTMTAQIYATSNYSGVGAEVAGVYMPTLNMALMYDPFGSRLRGYSQGQHGEGSPVTVPGIVGTCFIGTPSQMIVIDAPRADSGHRRSGRRARSRWSAQQQRLHRLYQLVLRRRCAGRPRHGGRRRGERWPLR
ncbi:MAG: hypothetical protein QM783_02930 [Phycisphaerales bacterium]